MIAIPTKATLPTGEELYQTRRMACEATWLKDCPCDYKFFSDADLGLDFFSETVRTWRTKLMAKYAYDNGYDFMFRCDTDTYVWTNRLMACGFEAHDYMGYCVPYPKRLEIHCGLRTAHGGSGFFLSRRAMEPVIETPPFLCHDGRYWGDIWTGEVLWKHDIHCHRDTRFMDGEGAGNWLPSWLPKEHPYITIHPVPAPNMYMFHELGKMGDETAPPEKQLFEPRYSF